jgi:predicted AAA+ superfamily ATPase
MAEALTGNPQSIDTSSHGFILQELRNYFFVGGMPEAVKLWRDTGSMREAARVQEEILLSLKDDFSKYTPRVAPDCLDGVLQNAARSVGEQLKYTKLDESHSGPTNRKAFDLLCKARLLHRIPACDPSGLPLGATADPVKFKAVLLDIGLMQRACRLPVESALDSGDLLSLYRGKLAEQFVAQEMLATGEGELFYWARDARGSSAEVDYLAVRAMCDAALEAHLNKKLTVQHAALLKAFTTDKQAKVTDECLQLFGGYGYMLEYPIARLYADARVQKIYGGTNEIM